MANSDHLAACLQREEARVALAELREVMQRHNLSIEAADHGEVLEVLIGHNVVKTVDCHQLDEESLQDA
jgi:hypothetical protein